MDKPYKKLRAKLHKRREEEVSGGSFLWRALICLSVFLCLAGLCLRGGEKQAWLQNQLTYYMQGAPNFSEAYTESVEAFNQLCDRIVAEKMRND